MAQFIDYRTRMKERGVVGNKPTRFWRYSDGSRPVLLDDGRLSFLVVLHGELRCTFVGGTATTVTASQLIVVDKYQIREMKCVGDTVLLECVESDKMSPLMESTSKAFNMPCSEIIPLNDKLREWCEILFTDMTDNPNRSNDYHHERCRNLTAMLLEYPRRVLGTLYVPLYACSMNCHACPKIFVRNE